MRPTGQETEILIEPKARLSGYWEDLWRYRELFVFLAWRDLLVRYKQTVLGVGWSVLRPVLTMLVFTVVFGRLAGLPSGGVAYPILVFAAVLPWQLFSGSLAESSNSIVANANLISKVYFPRLVVLGGAVVVSVADFLVSAGVLALLMGLYGSLPGWRILALPLFFLLGMVASVGGGLWFAALNVKYRDFRHVVPFLLQLGLFISPVGFSSDIVPDRWRMVYSLNPLVGVIDGFRWALLGGESPFYWPGFLLSVILSAVIFASGLRYFRKTEQVFADII
jgi:lipopolysaccharide transport system permease protein